MADVKIGDKWMKSEFDFILSSKSISTPEPNFVFIEIPGTSDVIDLSESVSGDVEYKQRKISIVFETKLWANAYHSIYSKLANYIQGRKLKIVFNKDPGYYWIGRLAIADVKQHNSGQTITLTATVDPYKYETQSSLEPWDWDTFSFEDGIIRDYFDIAVPGSITIIGRRKRVCPKFICSGAMTVTYLGNTYNLAGGENIIPDIFLGEGEHVLIFGGSGIVDVDYRGASL